MAADTLAAVLKFLHEGGLLAVLVLILVGGYKRWWVWGWHHQNVIDRYEQSVKDVRDDRDDWKHLVVAAHVRERRSAPRTATPAGGS